MLYNLTLFDTLTKSKQKIKTLKSDEISFYVCGPTVYDFVHLGNARSFVFYDLLFRVCKAIFKNVKYARNITDIDDKIIAKAQAQGINEMQVAAEYTNYFHQACKFLNCLHPTFEPRASQYIAQIIDLINSLLARDYAYHAGTDIYFSVEKFKDYGKLSGRKIEEMMAGVRLEIDQNKNHPADFVLWKGSPKTIQNTDKTEISFEAKFYLPNETILQGRPGWHIECSAMSKGLLGENFDIHGGGIDLQFPHHENEIAQSVCSSPSCNYASYWVHNGFLMINGSKMSKSEGNFITINDLINQGHNGEVVRLAILNAHYNKPFDFSDSLLLNTKKVLDKFYECVASYLSLFNAKNNINNFVEIFNLMPEIAKETITNDLNISKFIAIMHTLVNDIKNTNNDPSGRTDIAMQLIAMGKLIGIFEDQNYLNTQSKEDDKYFQAIEIAKQRVECKKMKNFTLADELRNKALSLGYQIVDTSDGGFNIKSL